MSNSKINMDVEYKLKRIAENLYLDQKEKEKLFQMYNRSSPENRDSIVDEILEESKIRNVGVRHGIKQRLRSA